MCKSKGTAGEGVRISVLIWLATGEPGVLFQGLHVNGWKARRNKPFPMQADIFVMAASVSSQAQPTLNMKQPNGSSCF